MKKKIRHRKPRFFDWSHQRERIRKRHRNMYSILTEDAVCSECKEKHYKLQIHHEWVYETAHYISISFICKHCHSKNHHKQDEISINKEKYIDK